MSLVSAFLSLPLLLWAIIWAITLAFMPGQARRAAKIAALITLGLLVLGGGACALILSNMQFGR